MTGAGEKSNWPLQIPTRPMRSRNSAEKLTRGRYPRSGCRYWAVGGDEDVYPLVVPRPRAGFGVNAVDSPCRAAVSSVGTTHTFDDSDAAMSGSVCRY